MGIQFAFQFTVDSAIPLPPPSRSPGHGIYPFPLMNVGDSFFVAGKTEKQIGASIRNHKARTGRSFATRRVFVDGIKGVRVWRIA